MEGRLPPSFTPHPPTPLSLSLCYYLFLSPPPLPFLPRKGSLVAVVISHPGSLFSYITRCVESWNGASPGGPPLFVITRSLVKTHFEWLSPSSPPFFLHERRRGGRPRVHTTRCIRGSGGARIAVGPNVNIWNPLVCEWSSAHLPSRISWEWSHWVRHNEIETEANIILLDQEIYLNYPDRSISNNKFIVIVTG